MSPLARPVASSPELLNGWNRGTLGRVSGAKDTESSVSSSRVSARSLDRIASDLTDLDRDVLLYAQSLRLVTGGQLRRRFWPGDENAARSARRALQRLTDWRVLDRLPRRQGGVRAGSDAFVYLLGPTGHRLLVRLGFESAALRAPGERFIAHTLAAAEVVTSLHEAAATGAVELIEVQTEPSCWRGFLAGAGRAVLKPDLFLRLGAGQVHEDRWFVEVDMATEGAGALRTKLARYSAHLASGEEQRASGVYPRVIWAVPHIKRAEQLNRLIERHASSRWHLVTTHEALVPLLTSEARA